MNGHYPHVAALPGPGHGRLWADGVEGKGEKRVRGGRGSARPAAISTSRRRRVERGGGGAMREKEAEQTQTVCLDLKGKEGREEILAACGKEGGCLQSEKAAATLILVRILER